MAIRILRATLFAATLLSCAASHAHEYALGKLRILHPHALPTQPGQPNGAAYIGISNNGKSPDRLVSISSPAASNTELHLTKVEDNLVRMREVDSLEIAAGATLNMTPGNGYHIMLTGLKGPLNAGDKFPMTLVFEKAGKVKVSVSVDKQGASSPPAAHDHSR